MTFDPARALRLAQETFDIEAAAVTGLKARTGEAFVRAFRPVTAAASMSNVSWARRRARAGSNVMAGFYREPPPAQASIGVCPPLS